jgi:hypothetical protein
LAKKARVVGALPITAGSQGSTSTQVSLSGWCRSEPERVSLNRALNGIKLPNTGGIKLHASLHVTKTLLIAGEGWGGAHVVSAYDKRTGSRCILFPSLALTGVEGRWMS